uniref:Major facilitator superfamily (MFS) profile domain-containing protein n=1 Tax=Plectus sambesii TaxID=2011161 RepID=A0A914X5R6_9BILA
MLPPWRLLLTGAFVTLGGSFHFGYSLSVVNPTVFLFQKFLNQSLSEHYGLTIDELGFRFLWSAVAGLVMLGAMAGALIMPKLSQKVGRKRGLIISSILLLISFPTMGLSKVVDAFEMFAVGRFLCGVGIGMATGFQGLYLTEISPIKFRGFMGMLIGMAVSMGFILGSVFGLPQVFGTAELWPVAFYIEATPTILLLIFLMRARETPTYLLVVGQRDEARQSIVYYHGADANVEAVIKTIEQELELQTEQMSFWQIWLHRPIRNAAFIAIMLNVTVSFSGIMAFSYFGTSLLKAIGMSDDAAGYANAGSTTVGILSAVVSTILVERTGRKTLIMISLISLAILNTLMFIVVFIFERTNASFLGYFFLLFITLFNFLFGCGMGPLAWFIGTELSPQYARSKVQSLGISSQYITSFLSPIIYFPLEELVGPFSFFLFIIPLCTTAVYFYWRLPETKNREIGDIMLDLGAKSKPNRSVLLTDSTSSLTVF